jgi:hypothetical protein
VDWLPKASHVVPLLQQPLQPLIVLQTHWPPEQMVPGAHTLPQLPQLLLSLEKSAHPPAHDVYPPLQVKPHELPEQFGVAWAIVVVHLLPHAPQLFESLVGSTQVVPHSLGAFAGQPELHEYELPAPAQLGVPPLHVVPHAPQLLVVSMGVSQPCSGAPMQCA